MEATGFAANVADFVTLSGDLGFKKSGATIIAVGADVTAALTAGPASVSLADADFGLQGPRAETAFELSNGHVQRDDRRAGGVTATACWCSMRAGSRSAKGRR